MALREEDNREKFGFLSNLKHGVKMASFIRQFPAVSTHQNANAKKAKWNSTASKGNPNNIKVKSNVTFGRGLFHHIFVYQTPKSRCKQR